jgi:hypothetical protein
VGIILVADFYCLLSFLRCEYEDACLLRCYAVYFGRNWPTMMMEAVSISEESLSFMVQYPRRQAPSHLPPSRLEISVCYFRISCFVIVTTKYSHSSRIHSTGNFINLALLRATYSKHLLAAAALSYASFRVHLHSQWLYMHLSAQWTYGETKRLDTHGYMYTTRVQTSSETFIFGTAGSLVPLLCLCYKECPKRASK